MATAEELVETSATDFVKEHSHGHFNNSPLEIDALIPDILDWAPCVVVADIRLLLSHGLQYQYIDFASQSLYFTYNDELDVYYDVSNNLLYVGDY